MGGIGVALLVGKAVGYGTLLHSFHRARPGWLALCVPTEMLAYFGYIVAFRTTARLGGGSRLSLRQSSRSIFASLGATRLVVVGGPGLLYWMLRKANLGKSQALARLLALNLLLYGVFALLAWLAALIALLGRPGAGVEAMATPWLLGTAAAAVAAALVLAGLGLGTRTRRFLEALRTLGRDRRETRIALAGTALFWLGDISCLWAGLRAFDVHVGASALVLAYATSYAVTMLPVALGGAGGAEAAIALALRAVGVPLAPALLGVLAYRLFSFWLPTLPGLASLATARRLAHDLEAVGPRLGDPLAGR